MSANFVAALKAEITDLEAEIRVDPRYRKLQRLRETLSEYEPSASVYQAGAALAAAKGAVPPTILGGALHTKEEKVKAELVAYFQKHGPTHRSVLLEHVKGLGLMGHEKDPLASFAAYLSGWKDTFAFDGKGVWGLHDQFADAEGV